MMNLTEDIELYKGIFWITELEPINSNLYFLIPCDMYGNIEDYNLDYTAKTGTTYNHEKTWNKLPSKITNNKPYNYYPRGRVEINNRKAIIYCSPYIANNELKEWVIDKFNLYKYNGIEKIRIVADGSEHYKCYLDYI